MRKFMFTASSTLALALAGCNPDAPANDGNSTETGDGNGDLGDGDGDGEPGDGDGEPGDGDGDPSCECPDDGNWDQCGVEPEPLLLASTFTWPANVPELELDELCTVTSIEAGVTVTLDCPAGEIPITVESEPPWVPAFAVGEQVHLRATERLGMSEGDSWEGLGWRIDRGDDSQMLAHYINSGDGLPGFIGDPYMIEILDGVCEPSCGEGKREAVGVRFIDGEQEVLLFEGQSGALGEHWIRVRQAGQRTCTDGNPGSYQILVTLGEPSNDACALVLDQSYSSQEQLECGLGPNGVELCNWTISFDGSQYLWNYSDVGDGGDYSCAGLDLLSVPEGDVLGSVSPDGAVLSWDGVLYDRD